MPGFLHKRKNAGGKEVVQGGKTIEMTAALWYNIEYMNAFAQGRTGGL